MSSLLLVRDSTNNKNVVLQVDGDNNLSVIDSGANTSLTSIDGKITACNTGAVVVSSSALPNGAATESSLSSLNGKVTACDTGAVVVSSSALPSGASTESTLDAVKTAVEGTLTVSFNPSRTTSTLTNASAVSQGDLTSSVDCNTHNKVAIYGNSSSNTQVIRLMVSDDDTNYYENHDFQLYASANNGDFYKEFEVVPRYFKLKYGGSATMTTKYSIRS